MTEYIEKARLLERLTDYYNCTAMDDTKPLSMRTAADCLSIIGGAPAADVVEVVRCKNCKNYELMKSGNYHFCNEFGGRVTEKDFCSRGTKTDGGKG